MKTWTDVSREMQANGTPISIMGYCKIAFDAGQASGREEALNGVFQINGPSRAIMRLKGKFGL